MEQLANYVSSLRIIGIILTGRRDLQSDEMIEIFIGDTDKAGRVGSWSLLLEEAEHFLCFCRVCQLFKICGEI